MGGSAPVITPEGKRRKFYKKIEEAKQNKRTIDRSARTVDKERVKLQNTEKKTLAEIKTLAKQNKHVIYIPQLDRVQQKY